MCNDEENDNVSMAMTLLLMDNSNDSVNNTMIYCRKLNIMANNENNGVMKIMYNMCGNIIMKICQYGYSNM